VYAFLDETLSPLDRLHDAWYASYFVAGWTDDSRQRAQLRDECLTSNQRDCIHMNAKSLLLFMWWLISQPSLRPSVPFAPHAWGEQQCEQLYRTVRATGGSDSNFSLEGALLRISKAMQSEIIRVRRADDFSWPQHRKHPSLESLRRPGVFLSADLTGDHLRHALEQARVAALSDLRSVGIFVADAAPERELPSNDDDSDLDGDDALIDAAHIHARGDGSGSDSDDDDDRTIESDSVGGLFGDHNCWPLSHCDTLMPQADRSQFASRPEVVQRESAAPTVADGSGALWHKQAACAFASQHSKVSNDRLQRYRAPQANTN
jgi:hypothetical protein